MAIVIWGKFLLLLALIYVFGIRAAKSADIIAEKKKLAKAFMGAVFISMVTSFPELFTGISAVTIVNSPDIAMGEILGSCIFNLLIIGIIDISFRKNNFFQLKGKINILPLAFSFILINIITMAIAIEFKLAILNVSLFSILIFGLYLFFLRILYKERKGEKQDSTYENKSLKKEVVMFIISSIIIIGVGTYLPVVCKEIAVLMNWNDSFVGVIFAAFVTSFPELVVSFSTARLGAFDMLLGNITGSNLFNVTIVLFLDIFYIKNQIFSSVSTVHVKVGLIAMLMTFMIFFAVVRRSKQRILNLVSVTSLVLILLYIINLVITFMD
jgi:cation:H+ antiporter